MRLVHHLYKSRNLLAAIVLLFLTPTVIAELRIIKSFETSQYHDVHAPCINEKGQVAFCRESGAIWFVPKSGIPKAIVDTGDQLPEMSEGIERKYWNSCVLNNAGQLVFRCSAYKGEGFGGGFWSYDPKRGVELVAREGMLAPGVEPDVFGGIWSGDVRQGGNGPSLTDSGKTIFTARFVDEELFKHARDTIRDINQLGIWEKTIGDELKLIWKHTPKDSFGGADQVSSNLRDDFIFWSTSSFQTEGLTLGMHGVTVPLIHFEDSVKITATRTALLRGLTSTSMNNARHLAMATRVADTTDRTVFSAVLRYGVGSGLQALVYDWMSIPNYPEGELESNLVTLINRVGTVAIFARIVHGTKPTGIIFCPQGGTPRGIAATGQPAVGTDVTFGYGPQPFGGSTSSRRAFSNVVMNARDQIAFVASLTGDTTDEPNFGLWATRPGGEDLTLIARTGETIEVEPNDKRVIKNLWFAGASGNEDGVASGMNDRGVLVFSAEFTDGSAAVVISNRVAGELPEQDSGIVKTIEEALDQYADWEELADARLEQREAFEDSDFHKLNELARYLKSEYQRVQLELSELADRGDLGEIEYKRKIAALRRRARLLPLLWRALSERQFHVPPKVSQADEGEFTKQTIQLLAEYGHLSQIRNQVAAKIRQIESETPPVIELVDAEQRNLRGALFTRRHRATRVLKQFAGSIGPSVPGLLPKRTSWSAPDTKLDDGPLLGVRQQVSRLVKLKLKADGRLKLDRDHWNDGTYGVTVSEVRELAEQMLTDRGVSEEVLYSGSERRSGRREALKRIGEDIVAINLFEAIDGRGRGTGGGTSMRNGVISYRRRFSTNEMRGTMEGSDDQFGLTLRELKGPKRALSIESTQKGQVRILIESDKTFAMLFQQPNGVIRWTTIAGDETIVHTAENFAEFYRANTDYVEKSVIEYINAFGFVGPITRQAPEVRSLVIERLRRQSPEVQAAAAKEIAALDAIQFEVRQSAIRRLERHVYRYQAALETASKEQDRSLESRRHIQRLLHFHAQQTTEYDEVIDALKIVDIHA